MQKDFETIALEAYAPFIHKQAHKYHNLYQHAKTCCQPDYEEYYQEAAIGFLEAIRELNQTTLPVSPQAIAYAKHHILHHIVRNLVLRRDGIHRLDRANTVPYCVNVRLTSFTSDDQDLFEREDYCSSLKDVDLLITIETLPPTLAIVAKCLICGISRREMVRRNILPRRTVDHAVECLRNIFE